jgi:hypothetical protein
VNDDWYIGIRAFCEHWKQAPILEREFTSENDACIDAAKSLVECACRVIIDNLDNPTAPQKPTGEHPTFGEWLSAAVRVLKLDQVRDESFKKLISQYHKLATTLGDLRGKAGTLSHGKDPFLLKLSVHQRRAALLAADAIVAFLHEAYLELEPELVRTLEPYERFQRMNGLIDSGVGVSAVEDEETAMVLVDIHLPNGDVLPLAVEASRLLFEFDREAYVAALLACREAAAQAEQPSDA